MSKMEFGRKGPEGIRGEGCTGWDELRYAPPYHERDRGDQMLEQVEEINALLDSIDISDEDLSGDEEISEESKSAVRARLEDIRRKKAEERRRETDDITWEVLKKKQKRMLQKKQEKLKRQEEDCTKYFIIDIAY